MQNNVIMHGVCYLALEAGVVGIPLGQCSLTKEELRHVTLDTFDVPLMDESMCMGGACAVNAQGGCMVLRK